jgi:hypothetical protein
VSTYRLDTDRGSKGDVGVRGKMATAVGRRETATMATRGATAAGERQAWIREAHLREDLAGAGRPSPYSRLKVEQVTVGQTAELVVRSPRGSSMQPVRGSKPRGSGVSQRHFS